MAPMFVIIGQLSLGTESVGVRVSVFVCCPLHAFCPRFPWRGKLWFLRYDGPPSCLPNNVKWPMGPSTPLCVPLNALIVFCQKNWCCAIWFCFMSVSQGTNCMNFAGLLSFWPLYGLLWSLFLCVFSFLSGRRLVVLVQFQANRLGGKVAIPSGIWQAR